MSALLFVLLTPAFGWEELNCSSDPVMGPETYDCTCTPPRHKKVWTYSVHPDVVAEWPGAADGIDTGLKVWKKVPGSALTFPVDTTSAPRPYGQYADLLDNRFTVDVGLAIPWYYQSYLEPGWAAITGLGYDSQCQLRGADIFLNDEDGLDLVDAPPSEATPGLSLHTLLAHEFGHVPHLRHVYNVADTSTSKIPAGIMLPVYPSNGEAGSTVEENAPSWDRGAGKVRLGEDEFDYLFWSTPPSNQWISGGQPGVAATLTRWKPEQSTLVGPSDTTTPIWPVGPDLVLCPGMPLAAPNIETVAIGTPPKASGPWLHVFGAEVVGGELHKMTSTVVSLDLDIVNTATDWPTDVATLNNLSVDIDEEALDIAPWLTNGYWTIPTGLQAGCYRLKFTATVAGDPDPEDNTVVAPYYIEVLASQYCQ